MSKAIVIASREIRERWFTFVVAAGIALTPFLSLLGRGGIASKLEIAWMMGVVAAVAFPLGLSVMLGVSIVGSESKEKRLSFYFARPMGGGTIWYGKILASVLLICGSAAIILVPALLIRQTGWLTWWELPLPSLIGASLVACFVVLLLTHAATTMLRSKSMLVGLDFVAGLVFVIWTLSLIATIAIHQAGELTLLLIACVAVVITAALFFGGAFQLALGRIDSKRGHRELSLFLWSCLGVTALVLSIATVWITRVDVDDLTRKNAERSSDSRALVVAGIAKHRMDYWAHFLTGVASGTTMPIGPIYGSVETSGDGRKAAWFEPDWTAMLKLMVGSSGRKQFPALHLKTASLDRGGQPLDSAVEITEPPEGFGLSSDGSRAAVISDGIVTVYDIAGGRTLGAARLPIEHGRNGLVQFLTPDDLQIIIQEGNRRSEVRLRAYEFRIRERRLRTLLDVTMPASWVLYEPSSDGTRLIARVNRFAGPGQHHEPVTTIVFDLANGRQLFEAVTPAGRRLLASHLEADGRTVVLTKDDRGQNAQVRLDLLDTGGALIRSMDLGVWNRVRFEGEIAPGVFAVAGSITQSVSPGKSAERWFLDRVDINSGTRTRIGSDLVPIPHYPWIVSAGARSQVGLFSDSTREHYFAVDLRSGARRKLI